jgi:predicted nucleic acid-binding protein
VIIGVAAALLLVALAVVATMQRRTRRLRSSFQSEYDRAVNDAGSRRDAERELRDREERRQELDIVPLSAAAREHYAERWERVQSAFVDAPVEAVHDADSLLGEVMAERGYPVDDFEEQAAIVSVDHPDVVENYRSAHGVYLASRDKQATTEDLRRAMRHYRSLFEDLLGQQVGRSPVAREKERVTR